MAQGRVSYTRLFARHGMPASLVRLGDPDIVVAVTVLRRYAEEEPVAHEVSQQETRFTLRWEEIEATGFPLPIKKGDRILKDGIYFTIRLIRPLETHGELVGYELRAIGS